MQSLHNIILDRKMIMNGESVTKWNMEVVVYSSSCLDTNEVHVKPQSG